MVRELAPSLLYVIIPPLSLSLSLTSAKSWVSSNSVSYLKQRQGMRLNKLKATMCMLPLALLNILYEC